MDVRELTWDERNEAHIARHGVEPEEVEDVCFSQRSLSVRMRHRRYRVIGQTVDGRYLTVILDSEQAGTFYVVTSRDATDPERRRLHRWRGR